MVPPARCPGTALGLEGPNERKDTCDDAGEQRRGDTRVPRRSKGASPPAEKHGGNLRPTRTDSWLFGSGNSPTCSCGPNGASRSPQSLGGSQRPGTQSGRRPGRNTPPC